MTKNILITGGAGFVGSNLAIYLKNKFKDSNIICLDNLIRAGSELNIFRLQDEGVTFIQGDVRDRQQLLGLPEVDLIIGCSAEPSVLASYDDPAYTIDTNLMGTVHCLELAKRDKAGFVFLSTSRVYPVENINNIFHEEFPTRFDWPKDTKGLGYSYEGIDQTFTLFGVKSLYGTTKLCSEQIILEFLDMYPCKGVINRLGVIAGPWQMGKVDQGFVGHWIAKHKYGGELNYIGYGGLGKQVRDVVHIDDVCDLILHQIIHLDSVNAKVFNVGGGRKNAVSLLELTTMTQDVTGKKITVGSVKESRKADVRIYITNNDYVTKETGWTPKKNVKDVLEDADRWMGQYSDQLEEVFNRTF